MNALDLKKYISKNDLIPKILESLECHSITPHSKEYRAGRPDGKNPTAISVKKDSLRSSMYSLENEMHGDIFTLIMDLKDKEFVSAIRYVHRILGLKYEIFSNPKEDKKDILEVFKKVKSNNYNIKKQLTVYDESILQNFINKPNIWWIREGIPQDIQEKFKLGYCPNSNRITIPIRYWCGGEDDYIGCKGRTVLKDYELLGVPKYIALINFPKTMNIYGLQENYKEIQRIGKVIVFESEKSVLKMASCGHNNAVAIMGHKLSQEQLNILIGLDVEICFALDKDISEEFVIRECKKFNKTRSLSYTKDKYDILKEKMSPIDRGKKVFDYLYKHRVKV